jgi:hypothetical protein
MTKQLQAAIIYRGPFLIDNKPNVVIATYTNSNSKTGRVRQTYQTYILIDDIDQPCGEQERCRLCNLQQLPVSRYAKR